MLSIIRFIAIINFFLGLLATIGFFNLKRIFIGQDQMDLPLIFGGLSFYLLICLSLMFSIQNLFLFLASRNIYTHWMAILGEFLRVSVTLVIAVLSFLFLTNFFQNGEVQVILKNYLSDQFLNLNFVFIEVVFCIFLILNVMEFFVLLKCLIRVFNFHSKSEDHYEGFFMDQDDRSKELVLSSYLTNMGNTPIQLSKDRPVVMLFLRHLGCSFCKDFIHELNHNHLTVKGMNVNLVFVHMSDPEFANDFFTRFLSNLFPAVNSMAMKVEHVSDPRRELYRQFGSKLGSFNQLFSFKMWVSGIWLYFSKGIKLSGVEGDYRQLGSLVLLKNGKVQKIQHLENAHDVISIDELKNFLA